MKRLVVCSDGTWNTPEPRKGENATNVVHMARGIRPKDSKNVEQIVFYDWGVGTGNAPDQLKGGAFGKGIDKNIQDGYRFLVHNYNPGDELFLFGFSRGAYTIRSLVGLIRNCGLLKKSDASKIPEAYKMYRSRDKADAASARSFRSKFSRVVKVKFLGVWDTVGALGIPLGLFRSYNEKKYGFHDTTISSIVVHAYHALAIDEKRKPFAPTLWTTKAGRKNSEQMWFPGVHSDVGGGYSEAGLSYKALRWMVSKAEACGLSMNKAYLKSLKDPEWTEKLHNSYTGIYPALGEFIRPIGVTNSDETLHPSAKLRVNTRRTYTPRNLLTYLGMPVTDQDGDTSDDDDVWDGDWLDDLG